MAELPSGIQGFKSQSWLEMRPWIPDGSCADSALEGSVAPLTSGMTGVEVSGFCVRFRS